MEHDPKLYQETCKYVERVQEIFGNPPVSMDEWERTVQAVYNAMKFLVRRAHSATESRNVTGD